MKKEKAPMCSLRLRITDEQIIGYQVILGNIRFENKSCIKQLFIKV